MWQRIQTLYLIISLILTTLLLFLKAAGVCASDAAGEGADVFFHERLNYLILTIVLLCLNAVSLCFYKVRLLQMRFCILAALVGAGFQIWIVVDIILNRGSMIFCLPCVFPSLVCVLDCLSARAALKDEILVRSSSRLRGERKKK